MKTNELQNKIIQAIGPGGIIKRDLIVTHNNFEFKIFELRMSVKWLFKKGLIAEIKTNGPGTERLELTDQGLEILNKLKGPIGAKEITGGLNLAKLKTAGDIFKDINKVLAYNKRADIVEMKIRRKNLTGGFLQYFQEFPLRRIDYVAMQNFGGRVQTLICLKKPVYGAIYFHLTYANHPQVKDLQFKQKELYYKWKLQNDPPAIEPYNPFETYWMKELDKLCGGKE